MSFFQLISLWRWHNFYIIDLFYRQDGELNWRTNCFHHCQVTTDVLLKKREIALLNWFEAETNRQLGFGLVWWLGVANAGKPVCCSSECPTNEMVESLFLGCSLNSIIYQKPREKRPLTAKHHKLLANINVQVWWKILSNEFT